MHVRPRPSGASRRRAFTLAELLVVVGIIALLLAICFPPLQIARRQAMRTQCSAQLQQIGRALTHLHTEYGFYPLWDDGGSPIRYTWLDVLVQRHLIEAFASSSSESADVSAGSPSRRIARIGYCPADQLPDPLNAARYPDLIYPARGTHGGIDYSYGIGVPLSAGGWALRAGPGGVSRKFRNEMSNTAGRVLAGDAFASAIYNMSGNAATTRVWDDQTQFDNTIAWTRHVINGHEALPANLLFQDTHVATIRYEPGASLPVNTALNFVWQGNEPIEVNPTSVLDGSGYPDLSPPSAVSTPTGSVFPSELIPAWYTRNHAWTEINHK
jgi:prepilin-type N-terminal cleavage/methylation domain-containing protein